MQMFPRLGNSVLPMERHASTTAQREVTVELSSWIDLSMTLSSMICFTSFLSKARSLSFCSAFKLLVLGEGDSTEVAEEVDDDEAGMALLLADSGTVNFTV